SVAAIVSQFAASARGPDRHVWMIATIWNAGYMVLSIIVALLLLKYADRLAEKLYRSEETALPADARQLEQVAFGTLGAYFVVNGVRVVAAAAFQLATRPSLETETLGYLWRNQPSAIVDGIVQLVAGLILLLGRRRLAVAASRLRGRSHSDSSTDHRAAKVD